MLDEIDQLDSRKQSVLYTIFEWPSAPNSKLVMIGIANALDLTDRILPRLQARLDLRPLLLHFAPYTKLEIVNILTERLKQVLCRFDVASTASIRHFTIKTVTVLTLPRI